MIKFTQLNHSYTSLDNSNQVDWIGVTSLVDYFKPRFDPIAQSTKAARNPKSKWFGIPPGEIQSIWKGESDRSLSMGSWYHDKTEASILSSPKFHHQDTDLTVIRPIFIDNDKHAPSQSLENNSLYPEHLVYLHSEGLCGQIDRVEVVNHRINMRDYKTSKTIKTEGFSNWEGITARMKDPLSHLDDCNYVHYALQLSLYMYMILKHNPQFITGTLTLEHIIFEQSSEDKYGYPVYATDNNGDYIIKETKPYNINYLKSEVYSIINHLKDNRETIKTYIDENKSQKARSH